MAIEHIRFGDRLSFTLDVAAEARTALVPAFLLQPLVENAVRHGVERRAGSGRVGIMASLVDGDVELRVSDDGAGIEAERVPQVLAGAGGGIGISNVDARLRATFGAVSIDTDLANVDGAHITRGYRWWTAAGARRSLKDDGLTFGTNADAGVCIHFRDKVPSPINRKGHSALTVTVADLEGLTAALTRD